MRKEPFPLCSRTAGLQHGAETLKPALLEGCDNGFVDIRFAANGGCVREIFGGGPYCVQHLFTPLALAFRRCRTCETFQHRC